MFILDSFLEITGENFDPYASEEECGVKFFKKNKAGEVCRGRMQLHGRALLNNAQCSIGYENKLIEFLVKCNSVKEVLLRHGAQRMILSLYFEYADQCNIGFGREFVSALNDLGAELWISCAEGSPHDGEDSIL